MNDSTTTTDTSFSSIIPFNFGDRLIRAFKIDDEPWVIAKDVAEALGYVWNGSQRVEHVPEEWKGVTSVVTPSGRQNMILLSEQGLYFFLGRSDKPDALPFQKWIAGEVIPSLRKHGHYDLPGKKSETELLKDQLLEAQDLALKTQSQLVNLQEVVIQNLNKKVEESRLKGSLLQDEERARILELHHQGYRSPAIAAMTGRGESTIRGLIAATRHGKIAGDHV